MRARRKVFMGVAQHVVVVDGRRSRHCNGRTRRVATWVCRLWVRGLSPSLSRTIISSSTFPPSRARHNRRCRRSLGCMCDPLIWLWILDHITEEKLGRSSLAKTLQKAQSSISSGNMRKRHWCAFYSIEALVLTICRALGILDSPFNSLKAKI